MSRRQVPEATVGENGTSSFWCRQGIPIPERFVLKVWQIPCRGESKNTENRFRNYVFALSFSIPQLPPAVFQRRLGANSWWYFAMPTPGVHRPSRGNPYVSVRSQQTMNRRYGLCHLRGARQTLPPQSANRRGFLRNRESLMSLAARCWSVIVGL
jgi:hypothetical protein